MSGTLVTEISVSNVKKKFMASYYLKTTWTVGVYLYLWIPQESKIPNSKNSNISWNIKIIFKTSVHLFPFFVSPQEQVRVDVTDTPFRFLLCDSVASIFEILDDHPCTSATYTLWSLIRKIHHNKMSLKLFSWLNVLCFVTLTTCSWQNLNKPSRCIDRS
jgi:hypothetical protein